MKKIIHFLHVGASVSSVYRALTTQAGLAGWWTTDVTVEGGLGGVVDFRFLEGFNPDMKVVSLEPERQVRWKCVGGHDEWLDNDFTFRLQSDGDGTDVMFVQDYARELSDEVYGNYNFNWGYYLTSLKRYCENGVGTPYEPASG